jgi:hypothetical protein
MSFLLVVKLYVSCLNFLLYKNEIEERLRFKYRKMFRFDYVYDSKYKKKDEEIYTQKIKKRIFQLKSCARLFQNIGTQQFTGYFIFILHFIYQFPAPFNPTV